MIRGDRHRHGQETRRRDGVQYRTAYVWDWRGSNRHSNHGLSFDGEIEFEAEARINGTGDDIDEPADRHPRLQMPDR
ncbi:hypothetical protein MSC49_42430 (plasmid) [Methylosinus sp. C49]|uniref:hypothetical protein n=1 Tax=Methylosinus sp. C49 TaxID=2699395 RepID=UPI0013677056|nr:hypothetical protein [Methylosinus sp. C49]BBU64308.1 hypothetical protein MSC49_42430 [Methylosinus sp. C49]